METITIEFQSSIKAKILEMLHSFPSNELKIVHDDPNFVENKQKLKIVSDKIENGTAQFCSFEELDEVLEKTISKYEN
jgi:hypothetical protein